MTPLDPSWPPISGGPAPAARPPERRAGGAADLAGSSVPGDPIVQLCAFRVGDEEYAIDLRRLREILQPLPVIPVPRAPEYVEGVMRLRDEVIPVVDVRRRLGLPPRQGGRAKVLIVKMGRRVLGLEVDAVSEVVRLPRSAIGPAPLFVGLQGPPIFVGVCGTREPRGAVRGTQRVRLLLDVKALLSPLAVGSPLRPPGAATR